MLARSKEEIDGVLAEAERIRAGEDPSKAAGTTAEASTAPASGGTQEGASGAHHPEAPSPSFDQLAALAVVLCDWPFIRFAGPQAALPEPFRQEAHRAWVQVLERYLPSLAAQTGPVGVLVSIYALHGAGLYLTSWPIAAQSRASSGNGAPESPLS